MMTVGDKGPLQRPYTVGTFQKRLDDFQDYIRQITYQEEEATPEERRQMITGKVKDQGHSLEKRWLSGPRVIQLLLLDPTQVESKNTIVKSNGLSRVLMLNLWIFSLEKNKSENTCLNNLTIYYKLI